MCQIRIAWPMQAPHARWAAQGAVHGRLERVRKSPWLRAFYQRLIARGKLPKVALVAPMHKLMLAIYSIARHRRTFVPHLIPPESVLA